MRIDLPALERKLAGLLAEYPELAEDEDFRANVIEGETDAFEIVRRLARDVIVTGALSDGLSATIKDMRDRKERMDHRVDAGRDLIAHIMRTTDLRKMALPECTLAFRAVPPSVEIIDETALPSSLTRTTVSPDKAAIKEALKAGDDVPGARLTNGGETLSMRIA